MQIGPQSRMAAIHIAEYVKRKGLDARRRAISVSASIRSAPARPGAPVRYSWAEIAPAVTGAIKGLAAMGFKGPLAAADGRVDP